MNKSKKQKGRPRKQTSSSKTKSTRTNTNNEKGVNEEDTRFGVIQREDNGEVVMTQQMFEDIQTQFDTLSERMKFYTRCRKIEHFEACTNLNGYITIGTTILRIKKKNL